MVVSDLPVAHIHHHHLIKDEEEAHIPPLPRSIVEDHHLSPHQDVHGIVEDHPNNIANGNQFPVAVRQVILNQAIQMIIGDLQLKRENDIPILLIGHHPLSPKGQDI